jgi:hypothetical protein
VNGELGRRTKEYYERLYDDEILKFRQLTSGHAANPDIRDQINLYLEAGNYQIPMEPYSNAGRMRALVLSFVFALLEKPLSSLNFIVLDDPALSLDDEHKARFVEDLVKPIIRESQVFLGTHYQTFFDDCQSAFIECEVKQMIPRRKISDQVEFEAGDLLFRVEEALKESSGAWREVAGNIRIWMEKTLATISGYCPRPFIVFNNLPMSIDNYSQITDSAIATPDRDIIVNAMRNTKVQRVMHKVHHNESIQRPDVRDAFEVLNGCRKAVNREITRFKELYNHALMNRKCSKGVTLKISRFKDAINKDIYVVREAAAAHNSQGIEWECFDEYTLDGCQVIQICSDALSPIALSGQYLLLDREDREPKDEDIVVVETEGYKKYVRRIWHEENGTIILEGLNPTKPHKPIRLVTGECKIRRVVGVLYDNAVPATFDEEWSLRGVKEEWFDNIVGVRVKGTSLEPLARNNQIVMIKKSDIKNQLSNDMLACFSIDNVGEVIKRCYIKDSKCILSAINPNERENPILVGFL